MRKLHLLALLFAIFGFIYMAFFRHLVQPSMPRSESFGDLAAAFAFAILLAYVAGKRFAEGRLGQIENLKEDKPFLIVRWFSDSHTQKEWLVVLSVDGQEKMYSCPGYSYPLATHLRVKQDTHGEAVFEPLRISPETVEALIPGC